MNTEDTSSCFCKTGKQIHSADWSKLPINDEVVKRVEELAKIEKQPTFYQYPMFECEPGISILDNMKGNEDERPD